MSMAYDFFVADSIDNKCPTSNFPSSGRIWQPLSKIEPDEVIY